MKKYIPTASFFLDRRSEKKSGKYPLKITIYCKPHKKRYSTSIDLTVDEWGKVNSERLRDEALKTVKIKMNVLLNKV